MYRERMPDGTIRLTGERPTIPVPPVPLDSWPVGSIYISVDTTSPETLFGGTWSRFANGRVLVGVDETDTQFDTVEETGGEKTHVLTDTELASHTHGAGTLTVGTSGGHQHLISRKSAVGTSTGLARGNASNEPDAETIGASGGQHTHGVSGDTADVNGSNNEPHNNLQPYITVYMWRRTA